MSFATPAARWSANVHATSPASLSIQLAHFAARCSRAIAVGRPGVFFDVHDWRVASLLIELTSCNGSLKNICDAVTWFFSFRLTRCQVNCERSSGTYAYRVQRRSRAKVAKSVSPLPPPKGRGKIKEVFKAFRDRGVVPKWTAYRKAQASHGWNSTCFAHFVGFLYRQPGASTVSTGTGARLLRAKPGLVVCGIAFGYAKTCSQECL